MVNNKSSAPGRTVKVYTYPRAKAEWLAEMRVRARLTDAEINSLALELKLDLSLGESWETIESMSKWRVYA